MTGHLVSSISSKSTACVYADGASDCSPKQQGSRETVPRSLDAVAKEAPEPCSGNMAASPYLSRTLFPANTTRPLYLRKWAASSLCFSTHRSNNRPM